MVVALFLGGCQTRPTVDEIVNKIREVEATTEDAHAIVEVDIQGQGMDAEMVIEAWEKRPDKFRANLLETSSPDYAPGSAVVSDGSQVWVYDPAKNEVLVGEAGMEGSPDQPANPRDMIRFVDEAIQQVLDHSRIKLVGEQEVAGVATYKLSFELQEDDDMPFPVGGTGTLWVDQERWVVLQAEFTAQGLIEGRMSVRSFALNEGVDDDLFQFEIPEGTKVVAMESLRPTHLTLDEAQAQADFLLVPAYVPEGVTLIDVLSMNGTIILRYDHSATSFTIVQGPEPLKEEPTGQTSEVSLRGGTATLITDTQGNSFLSWVEDGVTIIIAGRISQDEAVKVAESLQ